MFKAMNSRKLQPRLLYPAQLSFRIEEQLKRFPDKKIKLKFIITKILLYEILKVLIKEKSCQMGGVYEAMGEQVSRLRSTNR